MHMQEIKSPSSQTSVFAHTLVCAFSPIGIITFICGKAHVEHSRCGYKNLKSADLLPLISWWYFAIFPFIRTSAIEYLLRNFLLLTETLPLQVSCGVLPIPLLLVNKWLPGLSVLTLYSFNFSAAKFISRFTGAILEEVETAEVDFACKPCSSRDYCLAVFTEYCTFDFCNCLDQTYLVLSDKSFVNGVPCSRTFAKGDCCSGTSLEMDK